ncbi:MAG: hypothetical protein ACWGQW_03095 [bacterium]
MKDLIEAFNSWFGLEVSLMEEAVSRDEMDKLRLNHFIEMCAKVRGFLKDYDEGLIAHMGDKSAVVIRPSKVTLFSYGAFQEGKAIEVMYELLHSIKEFNQLSFDARGELAVRMAGILMDSVQENL